MTRFVGPLSASASSSLVSKSVAAMVSRCCCVRVSGSVCELGEVVVVVEEVSSRASDALTMRWSMEE